MAKIYPQEWQESAAFHGLLTAQGFPWNSAFHPRNEGVPSGRAYAMGVVPGIPDHIIPVRSADLSKPWYLGLAVEMKRQREAYGKSSSTWAKQISEAQRIRIQLFRKLGWFAVAAFGAEEAEVIWRAYKDGRLEPLDAL